MEPLPDDEGQAMVNVVQGQCHGTWNCGSARRLRIVNKSGKVIVSRTAREPLPDDEGQLLVDIVQG